MSSLSGKMQIPLIHESRALTGDGILNNRQKTWLSGATNDYSSENPVLYKHKSKKEKTKKSTSDKEEDLLSVQGLPSDHVDESKSSALVIEKIQESRRDRHEATWEDMMQELAAINAELEPQVQEICQTIKSYLDEDVQEMESLFNRIEEKENLITFSITDLDNIWEDIEKHLPKRMDWIEDLNEAIEEIEKNRVSLLGGVFKSYTTILERVAHKMLGDVHRLLEEEVLIINRNLLINKKVTTELMGKLMIANIDLQRRSRIRWQNRVQDWKKYKLEETIENYRTFMNSESVINSPVIKRLHDDLVANELCLNKKRLDVLDQLRYMAPPASTKSAVYQWNRAITFITDDLDQIHTKYITEIKDEQEKIVNECDLYIKQLKDDLETQGIVDKTIIEELMQDTFLPLFGERTAIFDANIERMEKNISELSALQKEAFKSLFVYCQGSAHVWDNHEVGLTKEQRNLQEMLNRNRREHDYHNQMKEAKLDMVIDKMRQDSFEEILAESLDQVLIMMDEIKEGYLKFHRLQKSMCESYPKMVSEEVQRYKSAMCRHFHLVSRNDESTLEMEDRNVIRSFRLSNGEVYDVLEPPATTSTSISTEKTVLPTKTFITDLDSDVEKEVIPYIDAFSIPVGLFDKLKEGLCLSFLESFAAWEVEACKRANGIVVTKFEEIDNELDLRLHLHEPRPGRARNDVHNIRLAELAMHEERVEQHCVGIDNSLDTLRTHYQEMLYSHFNETERFRKSVEDLEIAFGRASNTSNLKGMQDEVTGKLGQFMEVIQVSVRHFRFELDEMLNKLRNSNTHFRKSLKLFSEGGNFSPDEVDEYRKRLEKASLRIDQYEGSLAGELEGIETKSIDVAKEHTGKLEERFKFHLLDLTFMEKTKRWLTNIQVKIKAEVANSNSHSQQLSKMLSVFKRRVELIKHSSADGESYTADELHQTLVPILSGFRDRVMYLNCSTKKESLPSLNTLVDSFRPSKSEEKSAQTKTKTGKRGVKRHNGRQKRISSVTTKGSQISVETPVVSPGNKEILDKEEAIPMSTPAINNRTNPSTGYGYRRNSMVRTTYGGRYDKKYQVFGDAQQETSEADTHFNVLNTRILQMGLDGLLSTAELYYRQRGQRLPTRPQFINETFDACADSIIQRLKKYKQQTDVYLNECVQEFRVQIKQFSGYIEELPHLLMVSMVTKYQNNLRKMQDEFKLILQTKKKASDRIKKEYQTLLRPTLGHPNNQPEMKKLQSLELSRQQESDKSLEDYERLMTDSENVFGKKFLEEILNLVSLLMVQFDLVLTFDEVIEGDSKPQSKSEKELIYEKMLLSKKDKQIGGSGKIAEVSPIWPSIDTNLLKMMDIDEQATSPVRSVKNTCAHKAVIEARDKQTQRYFDDYCNQLKEISGYCANIKREDERWKTHWNASIERIMQLY